LEFDVAFLISKIPFLMTGLKLTLWLSFISLILSLLIGITGAIITNMRVPVISPIVTGYVEFIRNTPLLVQIFFLYFALPSIGLTLSGPLTGIVALSLWGGAYSIENFRGGLKSVSKDLAEAGHSLGMNTYHVYRYIIVPIGFRVSFPSFSNTAMSVVKNSSLLAGIGVLELTFKALDTVAVTFKYMEMFALLGVIYLLLIWILSFLFGLIERKLDVTRHSAKKLRLGWKVGRP
jgi:His/Glu/Gln/Arg/opine family amino acid ABC transporter permease subunit